MSGEAFGGLEEALVKENDLLLLGVNAGDHYIPLRVMARVEVPYLYDPIAEGQLPAPLAASPSTNGIKNNTWFPAAQLGSTNVTGNPVDVFDLTRYPNYVYQMFIGVSPALLRVYLQQPFGTNQRSLPLINYISSYAQAGYFDGHFSPLYRPSKKTQTWVLPGMSIGLGYQNIEPVPSYPLLMFYMNALNVGVVTDAETAYKMISEEGYAKIFTVGGLQPTSYDVPSHYNIAGIHLDDTMAEVSAGVTVVNPTSTANLRTRQQ
jgi:hypothetical protein